MHKKEQNLLQNYTFATNVRVQNKFWQNAHMHAMCVRPKIECANVRACEAKNRCISQFVKCQINWKNFSKFCDHLRISELYLPNTYAFLNFGTDFNLKADFSDFTEHNDLRCCRQRWLGWDCGEVTPALNFGDVTAAAQINTRNSFGPIGLVYGSNM